MKSQQEVVEFLELTTILLYRIYYTNKKIRNNIKYNIVNYKKYYYKTLNIKVKCVDISKIARKKHLKQYKIIVEFLTLQSFTFVLNIIFSQSNNLAYFEFASIVRKIIFYLLK